MTSLGTYTPAEERANVATHAAAAVLSVAGLSWMLYASLSLSDPWRVISSIIYGTSLIALFSASTVYHYFHESPNRALYKLLDHCAIYLLIAGTYTPFLLVAMRESVGWWLFAAIWLLALAGIIKKIWIRHRYPRFSLVSYLAMGWLIVIAIRPMLQMVPVGLIVWLVIGGLCYTLGIIFYAFKKVPYFHFIWHLFVLGGSISHFFGMLLHLTSK
jgi:hemolysin III